MTSTVCTLQHHIHRYFEGPTYSSGDSWGFSSFLSAKFLFFESRSPSMIFTQFQVSLSCVSHPLSPGFPWFNDISWVWATWGPFLDRERERDMCQSFNLKSCSYCAVNHESGVFHQTAAPLSLWVCRSLTEFWSTFLFACQLFAKRLRGEPGVSPRLYIVRLAALKKLFSRVAPPLLWFICSWRLKGGWNHV
jgi:hypothetical protein